MKTSLYIDQGVTQIVLTPENDFERSLVNGVENSDDVTVSEFFDTDGDWAKFMGSADFPKTINSLFVRLQKKPVESVEDTQA
jgi:hypothetical protein